MTWDWTSRTLGLAHVHSQCEPLYYQEVLHQITGICEMFSFHKIDIKKQPEVILFFFI